LKNAQWSWKPLGELFDIGVEARARELAAINGHPSSEPSEADYQQAKRELTGEAEMDPQEESSESVPDSDGWDPLPGSTGRQAADSLGEDEDAEGRSESAQLFEEGVSEAEHELSPLQYLNPGGRPPPGGKHQ
jgi:hypothetical protein